MSSCL